MEQHDQTGAPPRQNRITQEEFEAMRQRYAQELLAIRRSVDAMLGREMSMSPDGTVSDFSAPSSSQQPGQTPQEQREPFAQPQSTEDHSEVQENRTVPQAELSNVSVLDSDVSVPPTPENPLGDYQKQLTPVSSDTDDYDAQGDEMQPDEIEELASPDGETPPLNDTATIQVMVFAAQQAVPIDRAAVLISRQNSEGGEELIQVMLTDESGKTPILTVAAPDRNLTQQPGNILPFVSYQITVFAEGYLPKRNDNVAVFGGMLSVLPVELVPQMQAMVPPPSSLGAGGALA